MTPRDRLGHIPAKEILIHEAGHTAIGLTIGIPEGGIEFVEGQGDEIAKSHFSLHNVPDKKVVIRSLGGMYSQASLCQKSITGGLDRRILDFEVFVNDALEDNSSIAKQMAANGFWGDWQRIRDHALRAAADVLDALSFAQEAHRELAAIFEGKKIGPIVMLIVEDVITWFDTDDENIGIDRLIFYPFWRAREVYNRNKI